MISLTLETIEVKLQLEALIFLAGNKVSIDELQRHFKNLKRKDIVDLIRLLQEEYSKRNGALELYFYNKNAVGFRLRDAIHREPIVKSFTAGTEFKPSELKTLAFVGFFQPVEKHEILDLVGRGSKKAINTLKIRDFIQAEKAEYSVVNAKGEEELLVADVFTTTERFAQYFGVKNDITIIKSRLNSKGIFIRLIT